MATLAHCGSRRRTRTIYRRHWAMYVNYCRAEGNRGPTTEVMAIHFFVDILSRKKFGVSSVWSIYACVNSGMQREYGKNVNEMKELKKFLINLTKFYKPKKAGF